DGHLLRVLGRPVIRLVQYGRQCLKKQFCTGFAQTVMECARIIIIADLYSTLADDVTRVQSFNHVHYGHTGLPVPFQYRTMDGGAAPVTRKQWGMDIHSTKPRYVQQLFWKNLAICCSTDQIAIHLPDSFKGS